MIIFNYIAGVVNNINAAFFKAVVEICDSKITGFLMCSANMGNGSMNNNNNNNDNNKTTKYIPFEFNASPGICKLFRISAVYSRNKANFGLVAQNHSLI
jgi:hypothetical protein